MADEGGQSTVELLGALPALLLAALLVLQLLVAGYALTLADGAAEAGALALASGRLLYKMEGQYLRHKNMQPNNNHPDIHFDIH